MMLLAALIFGFILYFAEIKLYRRFWKKGLSVKLDFLESGVNVGEHCILQETICNDKRMALPVLEVKFSTASSFLFEDSQNSSVTDQFYRKDLFSLDKNQRITRTLDFTATKRGLFFIREADVLSRDCFFAQDYVWKVKNDATLYVYPQKLDTRVLNPFFSSMMGEVIARKRVEEDLFAFRGLRDYRPTDSMRRINWKNTAHTGKLLVNLYDTTTTTEVCILADGHIHLPFDEEALQEVILSLASSVAGDLIKRGVSVFLRLNLNDIVTEEPVCIEMSAGQNHIEMIDKALARVSLKQTGLSLKQMFLHELQNKGQNRCYLIIASDFSAEFTSFLKEYRKRGIAVYAIVPYTKRNLLKKTEADFFEQRTLIFPWLSEV